MNLQTMSKPKEKLKYGKQDFNKNTIEVYVHNEIVICEMLQDEDGDFLFYYNNNFYWLKDCQRI